MPHIFHDWGEWQEEGVIYSVPPNQKELLFDDSMLVSVGAAWEIGCKKCPKIKVRVEYATRS